MGWCRARRHNLQSNGRQVWRRAVVPAPTGMIQWTAGRRRARCVVVRAADRAVVPARAARSPFSRLRAPARAVVPSRAANVPAPRAPRNRAGAEGTLGRGPAVGVPGRAPAVIHRVVAAGGARVAVSVPRAARGRAAGLGAGAANRPEPPQRVRSSRRTDLPARRHPGRRAMSRPC
jgi:hypothetical protein